MDTNLHSLPPMKRFTLIHHETRPKPDTNLISSSHLPAKKRKNVENIPPVDYSLPAKKRIWATRSESNPLSSIDLNVEYVLSPEKKRLPPNLVCCLPAKKRVCAVQPDSPSPEKKKILPHSPCRLPAKKRVWAIRPDSDASNCLLPTKKRVWAVRPELPSPEKEKVLQDVVNCLPAKKRAWVARPESLPPPVKEDVDDNVEDDNDGVLCAVCLSTDGDPTDPIVFCDGCDLMVHASCYGNPLTQSIPEGEWLCQKCDSKTDNNNSTVDYSCHLCPIAGGALKRTTRDNQWAHIGCAVLVPEVFFVDPEGRDGIDCSLVPSRRWKGRCYLCGGSGNGCVVECSEPKCTMSFHVGCGLQEDLCIQLIERRTTSKKSRSNSGGIVAAFCRKHTDIWDKQQQTGKFKIVARDED